MRINIRAARRRIVVAGCLGACVLATGCKNHLAFGTATKFGLDISQKPDQTVSVTMGYQRAEMASIPVAGEGVSENDRGNPTPDADNTHDAYSVLGRFSVKYGDPWKKGPNDGLRLKQFFATGMAARKAAQTPEMQRKFGEAAYAVDQKDK